MNWDKVTLDSICTVISSGGTPSRKHPEYFAEDGTGHPWVKSKELLDKRITDTEERITDAGLKESSAKYYPANTVLVAMYGANVGQLGWLAQPATVNQAICGLVIDPAKADWRFVFYSLLQHRGDLVVQAQGAAQQNLNQDLIRNFAVPNPPLGAQALIAGALAAYDNLIENNLRRIQTLEKMARAIYREWFVRFRFPGHTGLVLVESAAGRIPKGWEVRPLLEIASVTYGFPFESKLFNSEGLGTPLIRIRDIPRGRTETWTIQEADPRYHVLEKDILVGMDGDFHMAVWAGPLCYQNQRVARFRPKGGWGVYHLFLALEPAIYRLNATIVGTTVAHLGDKHLQEIRVACPPAELLSAAKNILDPICDLVILLHQSTTNLRATRDLLLPRLMSGRITLPEAEEVTAATL